jgi:hypothetical protein
MSKALMEKTKDFIPNNSLFTMSKGEITLQTKKNIYKQKG